jgi:hypothetical protein
MEKNKEQIDRIEEALSLAHREQTAQDLPHDWRQGVMRSVRRIHAEAAAEDTRSTGALALQRMILPLATATGLVAAALLAYFLTALPGVEQDLYAVLTQDPSGLIATQALGL